MKVRIGSFDEDFSTELAKALKSIGIGVEIRRCIDLDFYPVYFVEGKFSELRNKYEETELIEEIKRWKSYLDLAKDVERLDDFERKVTEIIKNEKEDMIDVYATLGILYDMLEVNGMIEKDKIKDLPEDPIIRFPYEADEDKAKKLDLKQKLIVTADVSCEVLADLGDAILNDRLAKLCEEYEDAIGLLMIANVAEAVLERIADRKVEVEEILSTHRFEFGEKIEIRTSSEVLKAILEDLEKAGFVKIKKGKVSLKG